MHYLIAWLFKLSPLHYDVHHCSLVMKAEAKQQKKKEKQKQKKKKAGAYLTPMSSIHFSKCLSI